MRTNSATPAAASAAVKADDANIASSAQRPPGMAGELAAEFFGTFIMILIGVGAIAQVVAGKTGSHDTIAWA